jgi:hypothetical protein
LSRPCSYSRPTTHERNALLPEDAFTGSQYACKACKAENQRENRAKKRKSPQADRLDGKPPVPFSEQDTEPGVPPPSLKDGAPDWGAFEQASPKIFSERLLPIGDLHMPIHHPDAMQFLAAIKMEYAPDCVVQVGDETDFRGLSFHDKDPDMPGPSDELKAARRGASELRELFPIMYIVESNHGSLLYRKALASGIPTEMVRTYNEVLQVGNGWRWIPALNVDTKTGPVRVEHGQRGTARNMSKRYGMSLIQGHRHSESYAEWWDNSLRPMFAMQTGCLIDNSNRGFWYNRNYRDHPVISTGIVIDGEPFIIRMGEMKSGRWDLKLRLGAG